MHHVATLASLPHDVFALITAGFSRRDIAYLLRTSQALRSACTPFLVKNLELRYYTDASGGAVCAMLDCRLDFAMAVRSLGLNGRTEFSQEALGYLANAVKTMANLRDVTIDDAERLFFREPRLATALASCRAVKTIRLEGDHDAIGSRTVGWLRTVSAPIQELYLCVWPEPACRQEDLLHVLLPFSRGLETLEIHNAAIGTTFSRPKNAVWPFLTTLTLRNTEVNPIVLAKISPGMQTVVSSNISSETEEATLSGWSKMLRLRVDLPRNNVLHLPVADCRIIYLTLGYHSTGALNRDQLVQMNPFVLEIDGVDRSDSPFMQMLKSLPLLSPLSNLHILSLCVDIDSLLGETLRFINCPDYARRHRYGINSLDNPGTMDAAWLLEAEHRHWDNMYVHETTFGEISQAGWANYALVSVWSISIVMMLNLVAMHRQEYVYQLNYSAVLNISSSEHS